MKKSIVAGGITGALLVMAVSVASFGTDAAETVLIRGIVKETGTSTVDIHFTHIAVAPDLTKCRGETKTVNLGSATKYKWRKGTAGKLEKVKVLSLPPTGSEVVFKGTMNGCDDGKASWIVTNYRMFEMTGTLEGMTLDTNPSKTDAGYATVNISKLEMLGIVPARKFKEVAFKGVEVLVRFNSITDFTALGKSKQADEVTAGQQTVIISGELENEGSWVATTFKET